MQAHSGYCCALTDSLDESVYSNKEKSLILGTYYEIDISRNYVIWGRTSLQYTLLYIHSQFVFRWVFYSCHQHQRFFRILDMLTTS